MRKAARWALMIVALAFFCVTGLFACAEASPAAPDQAVIFLTPSPTPSPTPAPTPTPSPTPSPTPAPTPLPDTLRVKVEAEPTSMVVPEEVRVKISLLNPERRPVCDVRICRDNGSVICEPGTLSEGDSASYLFDESVTPTDTQLSDGVIVYIVRYTLGKDTPLEAEKERYVSVALTKLPAQPSVEFIRTLPVTAAVPGEEVPVVYRVKNTGNVALTGLVITDELLGDVDSVERLDPGDKHTVICRYRVEKTSVSKPVLTYSHRATRDTFTRELTASAIYLADERLDIDLEADKTTVAPGGVVTLTYRITNNGTVAYEKLRLSDQALGELNNLPSELKPGQEYVFTKTVAMTGTTTFLFTITGRSVGGTEIEVASNPLTIAVTPAERGIDLTLDAQALDAPASTPTQVCFRITVRNGGTLDIANVRLCEQDRGHFKTLAVAAPGDTVIEQRYPLTGEETFVFTAEVRDGAGGLLTVLSRPVTVDSARFIGASGVGISPGASSEIAGTSYRLADNPETFGRMVVIAAAALVVLIVCLIAVVVSARRKKRRKRARQIRNLKRNLRKERAAARAARADGPEIQRYERPARKTSPSFDRKPGSVRKKTHGEDI